MKTTTEKIKELNEKIAKVRCMQTCVDCTNVVPGEGEINLPKLLIIGEAPGEVEDKLGRPFVGKTGQFLRYTLSACGIQDITHYYTNVLKCRPENNKTPTLKEICACLPYLMEQICILQPKVILCTGKISSIIFKDVNSMFKAVELENPIKIDIYMLLNRLQKLYSLNYSRNKITSNFEITIFFTFHPSFVLRTENFTNSSTVRSTFIECCTNAIQACKAHSQNE